MTYKWIQFDLVTERQYLQKEEGGGGGSRGGGRGEKERNKKRKKGGKERKKKGKKEEKESRKKKKKNLLRFPSEPQYSSAVTQCETSAFLAQSDYTGKPPPLHVPTHLHWVPVMANPGTKIWHMIQMYYAHNSNSQK